MREIKFRAWIKRKNELMYLKGFRYSGNEKIKITFTDKDCDDCTYTFLNKDVILEQFTGLHDKNGVEIYEGDLVDLIYSYKKNAVEEIGVISWDNYYSKFVLMSEDRKYTNSIGIESRMSIEVIGSIHESEDK